MFTGIVSEIGQMTAVEETKTLLRLTVQSNFSALSLGESIAVDGACLTVVCDDGGTFDCELSLETRALTIASRYKAGHFVNLERALCVGDRLGGHWIMGHVDKTLSVQRIETEVSFKRYRFTGIERSDRNYLMKKGSIAINGVSLTINTLNDESFEVTLIPHTLSHTTLQYLTVGSPVNVEFDWMAKLLVHQVKEHHHVS